MSAIDIDRFVQNIFAMPSTLSPSSELERGFAKPRKKSNFGFINSRKVITRGEATSPKAVYQVPVPLLALSELTLIDNDEIKLAVEGVKHHDSVRSEEFVVVNTPKTGSSSGTIKQIRGGKFGFISDNTCPSYDLFFHMSEVAADTIDQLKPGSHISYTVEVDQFRTDRFKAVAIHAIRFGCCRRDTCSSYSYRKPCLVLVALARPNSNRVEEQEQEQGQGQEAMVTLIRSPWAEGRLGLLFDRHKVKSRQSTSLRLYRVVDPLDVSHFSIAD